MKEYRITWYTDVKDCNRIIFNFGYHESYSETDLRQVIDNTKTSLAFYGNYVVAYKKLIIYKALKGCYYTNFKRNTSDNKKN